MIHLKRNHILGLFAAAMLASSAAHAGANLVTNGDFEQSSLGTASQVNSPNTSNATTLTGWANQGYTFLFTPGSADTTGSYSTEYGNYLKLWGPGDGSVNGLTSASPAGGNFVGSDGTHQTGPITQQINNLTIGQNYQLTFDWAAAQQYGFDGPTTEKWNVTFGNQSYSTATANNANHGFTPWKQESVTFTASAVSQTLSFLAQGTPNGFPPFSLLDGVSLSAVHEPATWAVMVMGLAGLGLATGFYRRRTGPAFALRR